MASVLPTTIGCTDAHASVLPVLLTEELSGRCPETREERNPRRGGPSGLATPIFSFSLSSFEPKSLRMIILTIILVPLIALSFDHQNHSKWHKWCHVRFTCVFIPLDINIRSFFKNKRNILRKLWIVNLFIPMVSCRRIFHGRGVYQEDLQESF